MAAESVEKKDILQGIAPMVEVEVVLAENATKKVTWLRIVQFLTNAESAMKKGIWQGIVPYQTNA